jgi:ribonuclease VapC
VIVVDSSALLGILLHEPAADDLLAAAVRAATRLVSAGTMVEAAIVTAARLGDAGERELDALVARLGLEVVPVDAAQVAVAREVFRRFGKGRHPAELNFGDLFAYALARSRALPLLFVGKDFARTDIVAALPAAG